MFGEGTEAHSHLPAKQNADALRDKGDTDDMVKECEGNIGEYFYTMG